MITCLELYISSVQPFWDEEYLSDESGTATTTWYSSPQNSDNHGSDTLSDSRHLNNMALTWSLIILVIIVYSDIVSDNSGSHECGPDKWGSDKCSFDMIPGMFSDKPGCDKQGSEKCTLTWSDDPKCHKRIPALWYSDGDFV